MDKKIRISKDNVQELQYMKIKLDVKSYDEVITNLLTEFTLVMVERQKKGEEVYRKYHGTD